MSSKSKATTALTAAQISDLLPLADRRFTIERGRFLFQEGMDAEDIYLVLSGKVLISKFSIDGRELSLRICGENDLCGELILFVERPKFLFNAKIMETAEIAAISKDTIENAITENNTMAVDLLKWMTNNSRKMQLKFRDLILNGKKGALYSTLIRMANTYGVEKSNGIMINEPFTNQELANFCGTSRESINRVLNDLKRDSVISTNKGKIILHDINYLRDEINCENCPIEFCRMD